MKPKTKKRPKTGGRQKGSGGAFVRLTIPKETAEQLPSNAKELKKEILDAIIERVKNQRSIMTHTCEFPHPEYGTLILSGQIFEAEPECYLEAHAVLDSAMTYDGEEMLTYANGNPIGFTHAEISEMESALLHRGERANRVKPTPKLLQFLRDEMLNV